MHTNTLIHGDCVQVLPTLASESVDFILTDPPYLVGYKARDGRSVTGDSGGAWLKPAFAQMHRVLKARQRFAANWKLSAQFTPAPSF
jgi:DNA modification methylase